MKLFENKVFIFVILAVIAIAFIGLYRQNVTLERRVKTLETNQTQIVNAINNIVTALSPQQGAEQE